MKYQTLLAAAGIAAFAFSPSASATEGGFQATKPGGFIGASAGVPPPGIYMFNQVFTYQANSVGPGAAGGNHTGVQAAVDVQGFLFVPGWTFLGATYDAVIVQPFAMASSGSPANLQLAGMFNTYIVPVELSWKLGTSGFVVKAGIGMNLPDGTKTGPTGLGSTANPYWTFEPELIVSYLKDGWNLSVASYIELNSANSVTHYTTGDIFHADFTATKTIGKWTFGPVGYFVGQVTNDSCPVACQLFYGGNQTLKNSSSYGIWAVGALLGYDFGPASVSIWATQDVSSKASNAAVAATGAADPSTTTQGTTVYATLSYRLWAPETPAQTSMYHK
jgi:hypothetical protein